MDSVKHDAIDEIVRHGAAKGISDSREHITDALEKGDTGLAMHWHHVAEMIAEMAADGRVEDPSDKSAGVGLEGDPE